MKNNVYSIECRINDTPVSIGTIDIHTYYSLAINGYGTRVEHNHAMELIDNIVTVTDHNTYKALRTLYKIRNSNV